MFGYKYIIFLTEFPQKILFIFLLLSTSFIDFDFSLYLLLFIYAPLILSFVTAGNFSALYRLRNKRRADDIARGLLGSSFLFSALAMILFYEEFISVLLISLFSLGYLIQRLIVDYNRGRRDRELYYYVVSSFFYVLISVFILIYMYFNSISEVKVFILLVLGFFLLNFVFFVYFFGMGVGFVFWESFCSTSWIYFVSLVFTFGLRNIEKIIFFDSNGEGYKVYLFGFVIYGYALGVFVQLLNSYASIMYDHYLARGGAFLKYGYKVMLLVFIFWLAFSFLLFYLSGFFGVIFEPVMLGVICVTFTVLTYSQPLLLVSNFHPKSSMIKVFVGGVSFFVAFISICFIELEDVYLMAIYQLIYSILFYFILFYFMSKYLSREENAN